IAVAFSTDGDIAVNKLVVLQDDKKLFPVYQIAPVVTQKALDASPGIKDALNKVQPLLTDTVMSMLNYEVDGKKREPADVVKEFPGAARPAVDDVSLTVEAGSFVVLLGPSGCGKTTLLKMVNRLYEPTGGEIFIDETEIHHLPLNALRRQIGYVIQQVGLF